MSNPQDPNTPGTLGIDYRETTNITHVHAAIQREKREPLSGSVPIPLWLMWVFIFVFGWGTYYLGQFNGGYSGDVFNERSGLGSAKKGGGGEGAEQPLTFVQKGEKVFHNCAQCHQTSGLGSPGQFPPLAGSEFVNGTPRRLAMILLKGLQGPITVEGKVFNGQMPAWGPTLTDEQIAEVLTYVRQAWGNKGGEVTKEQISHAREEFKARSEPWAPADILAVPVDAVLEGGAAPAPAPAPGGAPAPK